MFVVVLLCPESLLDDQGIRGGEVGNSSGVEVAGWKRKRQGKGKLKNPSD